LSLLFVLLEGSYLAFLPVDEHAGDLLGLLIFIKVDFKMGSFSVVQFDNTFRFGHTLILLFSEHTFHVGYSEFVCTAIRATAPDDALGYTLL